MKFTCPNCRGKIQYQIFSGGRTITCDVCQDGTVTIEKQKIINLCLASRGKNKGLLKTSKPKKGKSSYIFGASYVWRMARFHSGQDMTMPMTATFDDGIYRIDENVRKILNILDKIADEIAEKYTPQKSSFNAALRYKGLLY